MGQMTYGLIFGVPAETIEGLETTLSEYTDAKAKAINTLAKKCGPWAAESQVVPSWESESEPAFVGFFFAAGASGKDEVPYLEGFRLSNLATDKRYRKAMRLAAKRWATLADWCSGKGITLPEPELWLIQTEVA